MSPRRGDSGARTHLSSVMAATRTAARKWRKDIFDGAPSPLHVQLFGLPRTALPNDLRRLCGKSKVENVDHASVEYRRFRPTGCGLLSFTRGHYASAAQKALNGAVVGGKPVKTRLVSNIPELPRARGVKGMVEAARRGIISGDGPNGGVTGSGRNVVLYGLPGKLTPEHVLDNLQGFKLAGVEHGKEVVVKLSSDRLASSSRFLVRMSTVSEAYRLVRKLHLQFWRPEYFGDKCTAQAFVVS
ncbi:hypothetical protein BC628DRAFT_1353406 [Trametes gibbosa]|nr:hypothetical protein BC628DRAFT_1353406 [Trametes gibbosa]